MQRYVKFLLLILVFILIFTISMYENLLFQKKDYVFGTIVDIKIYGESKKLASEASKEILSNFNKLHYKLHPWREGLVFEINEAIQNETPFFIEDEEVISLILRGQEYESQTKGYFNPAIGKLVNLWGFHSEVPRKVMPDARSISKLVEAKPSMGNIKIINNILSSTNKFVKVDMGGYAKGYALDQAKNILEQYSIKNALINIGGNILALGMQGNKEWVVGIQDPRNPNLMASLPLKPGWSIGTSGDYQKYFAVNEKRYSHIINPHSGYPVSNTMSVTVLIPPGDNSGEKSDVYSNPIFIEEVSKKIDIANELGVSHYLIVLENNEILISEDLNKIIVWKDKIDEKKITIY